MEFQIAGLKCVNSSDEHQVEFELASEMFDLHVRLDRLTKKGNMGICGVFVELTEQDDVLSGTIGCVKVLHFYPGSDGYLTVNGIASLRYMANNHGGHYVGGTLMGQPVELAPGSDGYLTVNGIASLRYMANNHGGHYVGGTLMGQPVELAFNIQQENGFIHMKQKTSFFNWKDGTMVIEDLDVQDHETVRAAREIKLQEFQTSEFTPPAQPQG